MPTCTLCTSTLNASDSPIEDFNKNRFDTTECRAVYYQRNIHNISLGKGTGGPTCSICQATIENKDASIVAADGVRICWNSYCRSVYNKRTINKIKYGFIFVFLISLSLAKQAWCGTGYAGNPAPEVTTVQGITGATPLNVTANIVPTNNPATNQIVSSNVPLIIVNTPSSDAALVLEMEANTRMLLQDESESSQKQGFEIQ